TLRSRARHTTPRHEPRIRVRGCNQPEHRAVVDRGLADRAAVDGRAGCGDHPCAIAAADDAHERVHGLIDRASAGTAVKRAGAIAVVGAWRTVRGVRVVTPGSDQERGASPHAGRIELYRAAGNELF